MPDVADSIALQCANSLPDDRKAAFEKAYQVRRKDRTTALVLSLFLGLLGIDRFYLGHTGLGLLKLVTFGGLFVWSIVDLFLIMGATDKHNLSLLLELQVAYGASSRGRPSPDLGDHPISGYHAATMR